MRRTPLSMLSAVTATATLLAVGGLTSPVAATHSDTAPADLGEAGDDTIVVPINDSTAGGTYYQPFEKAYAGKTDDGTPVYVYVPVGDLRLTGSPTGVHSLDPAFDHDPGDDFVPCAENLPTEYVLTQAQIDHLGDTLSDQILAVNEDHFGELGAAASGSDALVTLVYNVQDDAYYDCATTSYTAGYFAPEYLSADSLGMNVMVIDAFDWANRVGSDPSTAEWSDDDPTNDRPELYEGVVAHELEHMLMNYSDPGELSWVDEGLADMAAFLNGFDMTGSHLTYQQVFHRETSLTRWAGGLENYGASFSYFLYLWEQAGGNGDGSLTPDLEYDGVAGDLLIKTIFAEQADGMEGVQNAIDDYNAQTGEDLRSAEELFKDWVVAMYLDDEDSSLWDIESFDLGAASGGWTIDVANNEFWDKRGNYSGAQPESKWDRLNNRPASDALPFGTSYETFRNPGEEVTIDFTGDPETVIAPHTGDDALVGRLREPDRPHPQRRRCGHRWRHGELLELALHRGGLGLRLRRGPRRRRVGHRARHRRHDRRDGLHGRRPARQQHRGQRHHRHLRRCVLRRRAAVRGVRGHRACRCDATCGSATRPTPPTSTPGGSSTTCR